MPRPPETHRYNKARQAWRNQQAQADAPCWLCGQPIDYTADYNDTSKPDRLSLDHIATASDNPEHFYDPANWAPAHWSCNRQRSNRKPPAGLGSRSRKW
jgi:hypothetical protein|nr:MAG TPA: HNH endonuclease bacteriophage, HNH Endonuclease, DNA.52A [Caudoviricetes sp.]